MEFMETERIKTVAICHLLTVFVLDVFLDPECHSTMIFKMKVNKYDLEIIQCLIYNLHLYWQHSTLPSTCIKQKLSINICVRFRDEALQYLVAEL